MGDLGLEVYLVFLEGERGFEVMPEEEARVSIVLNEEEVGLMTGGIHHDTSAFNCGPISGVYNV